MKQVRRATAISFLTFVFEGEVSYRLVCKPPLANEEYTVGRGK